MCNAHEEHTLGGSAPKGSYRDVSQGSYCNLTTRQHLPMNCRRDPQPVGHVHRVRRQRLPRLDEDERGVVQPQEQLPQGGRGEGARARRLCINARCYAQGSPPRCGTGHRCQADLTLQISLLYPEVRELRTPAMPCVGNSCCGNNPLTSGLLIAARSPSTPFAARYQPGSAEAGDMNGAMGPQQSNKV
jgi:hypothetical protein